jgi:hypothetical protein
MFGKESLYGHYALRAFVLRTVNGVNPQQRPKLVCETSEDNIKRVQDFMRERDGARVTARSVARELGGVLRYSSEVLPARPIEGGWEAQRLSFVLAVDHVSPIGVTSTYNIAGYTNKMPLQLADKIDWSGVTFYVNSCLVERASVTRTIHGDRPHRHLEAAEHLIYDADFADMTKAREVRISPADMANNFGCLHLQPGADADVHDTRTMITSMARTVYRRHVIPARYLSELMKQYFMAHNQEFDLGSRSGSEEATLGMMRSRLETQSVALNPFFRTLSQVQGHPFSGYFSIDDLHRVLPAVVDKGVVAFEDYMGPEEDSPADERTNRVLVYLGQTVPALFHSMGFTTAQFQVDIPYHTDEEPTVFTFVNTRGMAGTTDTMERIKHVQGIMEREIFPELRRMDLAGGSLFFNVEVFGNSSIQYNLLFGEPQKGKRHFASYADALTSPLTTDSRATSMVLATDLYAVINAALDVSDTVHEDQDPFVI